MQIARLYRPLSSTLSEFDDDDDDEGGAVQLLPTHRNFKTKGKSRLSDVWDEREELFGIGDESDEEDVDEGGTSQPKPQTPKIVISHS